MSTTTSSLLNFFKVQLRLASSRQVTSREHHGGSTLHQLRGDVTSGLSRRVRQQRHVSEGVQSDSRPSAVTVGESVGALLIHEEVLAPTARAYDG